MYDMEMCTISPDTTVQTKLRQHKSNEALSTNSAKHVLNLLPQQLILLKQNNNDNDDDDDDNNNNNNNIFGSKNYCDQRPATYGGSRVLLEVIMGRESKAQ
jgi:hypothetical protein